MTADDDALFFSRPPPAEDATLTLDIDGWEGPLDLLLDLARRQKVDLREISILELVDQYTRYVADAASARFELAADYLVMAAWLTYLKTALLLPGEPDADPSPEELALRLQLRLERLNAMREAGSALMARDRLGRDMFARGAPEGLHTDDRPDWRADYTDLLKAYADVERRRAPVVHVVPQRMVMTLEDALLRVSAMLGSAVRWSDIRRFLPEDTRPALRRSALASSFLAALELAKRGRLEMRQADSFGALELRAISP